MNEVWVANASPIIVLARCGYLDLLSKLSREVLIPQAVVDEIVAGPQADPARQLIENGWGARAVPRLVALELLEWGLGLGELRFWPSPKSVPRQSPCWMMRRLAPVRR